MMCRVGTLLLMGLLVATQAAASEPVGLIFPDVPNRFRQAFDQIEAGFSSTAIQRYELLRVDPRANDGHEQVRDWVAMQGIACTVPVTDQMAQLVQRSGVPICAGAGVFTDSLLSNWDATALTLTACPTNLLHTLAAVTPQTKRIHVVIDEKELTWLRSSFDNANEDIGYELIWHPASELRDSVERYRELFGRIQPETDAIWIPPATQIVSRELMEQVYRDAWTRRIVVFSSNAGGASAGALWSVYPDNESVGKFLGGLIGSEPQPANPVCGNLSKLVVNMRVARRLSDRLGINIQNLEEFFDTVVGS